MAFSTQITDLVGGTIDQVACDQWAADACKEIIHQLPAKLKAKCSTVSTLTNSATTLDVDGIGDILHVTRLSADSGGYQIAAREIPAQYGGLAEDSTDLNYYATATDPVYWIDSSSDVSTLKVKPTTTANQTSIVHHISYPTVDVSAVSVIANFPDEAEYLVVLYVAVRQLLQYMSSSAISTFSLSASAPSAPTIGTVSYSDASNADAANADASNSDASATAVSSVTVATVAKADMDGNVPGYTQPKVTGDTQELTATITAGAVGATADFTNYMHWFDVLADMIETNEDIEMASIQLNKISTYIQSYQAAMQNQLNEFNEANVRYQANVQAEITKANADLQKAINQANIDAQDARQEAQQATEISKFNKQADQTLEQFNKQQDQALDQFNKSQDQALNLANASKQMEDVMNNNSSILQKHSAEIQNFSAKVNAEVQTYGQEIAEKSTEYQWYGDQYAKLSVEYGRGLAVLTGSRAQQGGGE